MSALGIPLAACTLVITACAGAAITDRAVDAATIQSIDGYCSVSWSRASILRQGWDDCTQHAIVRLLTDMSR